jgi:hypothetical protein
LLGYDFVVEYKPEPVNVVADALSRRNEESGELGAISGLQFSLFNDIREEINGDDRLSQLRDAIRGALSWRHGRWLTGSSCSRAGCMLRRLSKLDRRFWSWYMELVMRGFTRLYIA